MDSRRAWLMFVLGTAAYLVAVLQRSSLGVAAVDATGRFGITAAEVSALGVVQLAIYAGLQIPVGLVLDKVGPRVMIAGGALLMASGQGVLALAPSLLEAIAGRILLGAGDAMTFISVVRLLANWFSARRLPIVSQWMATIGQLGQVLSAIPFALLLHATGWVPAFLSVAGLSFLAGCLVLLVLKTTPTVHAEERHGLRAWQLFRESISLPGTQLGFWAHYVSQSSGGMLTLLWGFPLFAVGLGYGVSGASLLLTLIVIMGLVSGPWLGILSAKFPSRRSNILLSIVALMALSWTVFLSWPGEPPLVVVLVVIVAVGIGGPGSMIGFDYARTFNKPRSLGSANGIVNGGGFLATLLMMFSIGLILDVIGGPAASAEQLYSWSAFRIALLVQFPIVGIGVFFLLRARTKARRDLHETSGVEIAPLWTVLAQRRDRRRR